MQVLKACSWRTAKQSYSTSKLLNFLLITSITFKCYFIFCGRCSHYCSWIPRDRKKHSIAFKGMFSGLFKFSAIQMWCFAYSFNHRIISTFNQLKITGWHQRFRIKISEVHQEHSPKPVVESKPYWSRFEKIGIRKPSVLHCIFQIWSYFQNLYFPHTTGYDDNGSLKHT